MSTSRAEPLRLLFAAPPEVRAQYAAALPAALAAEGIAAEISLDHPPGLVDYIVYDPNGGLADFAPFTRARAVLSLWAGVERIVGNPTLTQPLARMVDPGMTAGMVEYVTGHALRHHLGLDRHIRGLKGVWDKTAPKLAAERPVTVLGMGELGGAVADSLSRLGFPVTGWSRRPAARPGLARALHGAEALDDALRGAEILILLVPRTAETEGLMDARRLSMLARGAFLINPGRGALVDDAALLAALDAGQLAHATLDVFRTEPLPPEHPFWHHPGITVTPHIAAETRADSSAAVIARNIARAEAGLPLLHLVDRGAGY